jgi:predicted lipoprotein with Yx(FWY)xxD motif
MKWRLPTLALSLAVAVLLAACGSSTSKSGSGGVYGSTPATSTPTSTTAPTAAPTTTPTPVAASSVIVRQNMRLGQILADAQGRTLYQFLPEKGGRVVCTGACLRAWPADLAPSVAAGAGVKGQLAVIARADGGQQVTYNTWPLYFFSGDSGPDQTNGQGIVGFGGKWLAATPRLQP